MSNPIPYSSLSSPSFQGVLVMNGVTITNSYAILFAVGGGFYNAIGAGVFIKNGVTFAQFNGPNFQVWIDTFPPDEDWSLLFQSNP